MESYGIWVYQISYLYALVKTILKISASFSPRSLVPYVLDQDIQIDMRRWMSFTLKYQEGKEVISPLELNY